MEDKFNKMTTEEAEMILRKRKHEARRLKWYERQYGAGFVSGFWVGFTVGIPTLVVLAVFSKYFLDWLGV